MVKVNTIKLLIKDGVEIRIIDPDSGFNPLSIKESKQFYYDNHDRPIDYDSVNKRWFRKLQRSNQWKV